MVQHEGHPNRLGILGWLSGGRWGPERYLYTLHRLTGLGLLAYFLMHILVTTSRALGQQAWEKTMQRVAGPVFGFGEYLVFLAFAFHAVNGIRVIILDFWPALWQYRRHSVNIATVIFLLIFIPSTLLILMDAFLP